MAKRKYVNNATRSRLLFQAQRLMKGVEAKDIEEISRRNGHKGVHRNTIKNMYKHPKDGGTIWPSSRTLETIIYALGAEIRIIKPEDGSV